MQHLPLNLDRNEVSVVYQGQVGADSFQGFLWDRGFISDEQFTCFSFDPLASKLGTHHLLTTMTPKQIIQGTENWARYVVKMSWCLFSLCVSRQDHLCLFLKNFQQKKFHNIPNFICFRSLLIPNVIFVWSCWTNYIPYPPISHQGEQITDFLFPQSFVFLLPFAILSPRDRFFLAEHPQ